jgi:uncharacterized repeat protein (TIGR01451 family)
LTRRVLAGVTSLTIGSAFVAASALAALADSPSPTTITANVVNNAGPTPPAGTVTVTVSGNLAWKNGGACGNNKFAGYAIAWGDPDSPGNPVSGAVSVGTTTSTFGQAADNLVHDSTCNGNIGAFGPISHTYASSAKLPAQVCAVAYHYDNKSAQGAHSRIAGGAGHNTDNSLEEPNAGLPSVVCVDVVAHKPDVTIAKTATPSVSVGETITYVVTASNAGDFATDQTVTVTDPLPAAVQFLSVTPGAGWTCNSAQNLTCTLSGSLAAHASASPITITAKALEAAKPSVTNTATVNTPDDSNPNNNQASATTTVGAAPQTDVTITKTATKQVIVGDDITYKMTVSNDSSVATDKTLTVSDNLPAGVQFKSVTPGNGWNCNSSAHLSCTYAGSLAAGASAPAITVVATALAGAVPSVTNIADVTNPNDSNPNNNEDSATTVVDVTAPVLNLHKSAVPADGSTVERGDRIDYTLNYSNTGNGDADNAVITDVVPANTTYVAGSAACGAGCTATYDAASHTVTWSLDIPASSNGSVTFAVTVNSDAADGTVIDNVGQLTSGTHKVPSNHVRHLVFVPSGDLRLHKSVDKEKAAAGDTLTYTLVAKATGNMTQHDVVVTDNVPDGTTFASADCDSPCVASQSGGVVSFDLGDMQPGDSQSMTFKVVINGPAADGTLPTEIPNVGHVKSNETPKNPSNRVVTLITTVLGTKIVKTTPPASTLPFTGLPVLQDVLLAMVLIGGGIMLLTWPRLQGRRAEAV